MPEAKGRGTPSMLNENTMYYSITDNEAENGEACVWRATANGTFPNKIWTPDTEPVVCFTEADVKAGAPFVRDVSVFKCKMLLNWIVIGSHWNGIWIVKLDQNTGRLPVEA